MKFACFACGQKLDAPDDAAGRSIPCPDCGQSLEIPPASPASNAVALVEPEPEPVLPAELVYPARRVNRPSPNLPPSVPGPASPVVVVHTPPGSPPGQAALRGGITCLLLGLIAIVVPLPLTWLYVPLFGVAVIAATVAICQGAAGRGILLLIATLVLPPILWVLWVMVYVGGR